MTESLPESRAQLAHALSPEQAHRGGVVFPAPPEPEWSARLASQLDPELLATLLEILPYPATLIESVLDAQGTVVDYTLLYLNAAARAHQPDPDSALGQLGSELWPDMLRNGTHDACLRTLATSRAEAGSFWWSDEDRFTSAGWEYQVTHVREHLALWVMHDQSERVQTMLTAAHTASRALTHAALLQSITERLAGALTVDEALAALADSGQELLGAAHAGVSFPDESNTQLLYRRLSTEPLAAELASVPLDGDFPSALAARTHAPVSVASREELARDWPHLHALLGESPEQAWVLLPILSENTLLAVMRFGFLAPHRLSAADTFMLNQLAASTATALTRIELVDSLRAAHLRAASAAEILQRSLLPDVQDINELEFAVRYIPGVAGTQAGGDWYDLIDLGAGRTAVVIGDVMGRGLHAAALMGQLSSAIRAYAQIDLAPSDVLTLLDRLVEQLPGDQMVTCCYGVYDLATREFHFASAGHLPPVRLSALAPPTPIQIETAPPLGAGGVGYSERVVALSDGESLALYTDGLLRSPERDLTEGLTSFLATLERHAPYSLEDISDQVLARLQPEFSPEDDAVLLLLRVCEHDLPASKPLLTNLPPDATAAAQGRRFVEAHATELGLSEECVERAVLIVSELIGNAVRHASSPFTLVLRSSSTSFFIEVSDTGHYQPYRRRARLTDESGRGVELMEALAMRWGVRPQAQGKVVWAQLDRFSEPAPLIELSEDDLLAQFDAELGL